MRDVALSVSLVNRVNKAESGISAPCTISLLLKVLIFQNLNRVREIIRIRTEDFKRYLFTIPDSHAFIIQSICKEWRSYRVIDKTL